MNMLLFIFYEQMSLMQIRFAPVSVHCMAISVLLAVEYSGYQQYTFGVRKY